MRLKINPEKCTGCGSCMLACSFAHNGVFDLRRSRIHLEGNLLHKEFIPHVCIQCAEAFCVQVCPTGALSKSAETGAILVDEEKCIGCGVCGEACPYHAITLQPEEGHVPLVCDLCEGDPECVKVCRLPQAITVIL